MRTANIHCRKYVQDMQPFKGHNLQSELKDNGDYVVISYGWYPIIAYIAKHCKWYVNKDGYSRSTGKHILQASPLDPVLERVSFEDLKKLLRGKPTFVGQGLLW